MLSLACVNGSVSSRLVRLIAEKYVRYTPDHNLSSPGLALPPSPPLRWGRDGKGRVGACIEKFGSTTARGGGYRTSKGVREGGRLVDPQKGGRSDFTSIITSLEN